MLYWPEDRIRYITLDTTKRYVDELYLHILCTGMRKVMSLSFSMSWDLQKNAFCSLMADRLERERDRYGFGEKEFMGLAGGTYE